MGSRPTIKMVAERAGVSRGTVDRVINNRSHVSEEVRERILTAMRELGYMPVQMAQAQALGLISAQQPLRLGVLLPNWRGYFYSEASRGIAEAKRHLEEYGVEVFVEKCETDLPDESVERIDSLAQKGVRGIALCSKNHSAVQRKIDRLAEAGVPVITFNSDIPESRRVSFVGEDIVRGGRVAGEIMKKCVRSGKTLLAAVGNLEFHAHKLRLQGFMERLQEYGYDRNNIRIVETYNDYTLSYQKITEELAHTPSIAGIYMANDSISGCTEAVRAAGRQGEIPIISHDVTEATRRLLKSGDVDFTIAQNIYRQGYRPLMLLYSLLQKNEQPETMEHLPVQIICSQNLED